MGSSVSCTGNGGHVGLHAYRPEEFGPCAVRKILFSLYLWRSARSQQRRPTFQRVNDHQGSGVTSERDVNKPTGERQSADRSMTIGWLNIRSLSATKLDAVNELIVDRPLDVLALTETWHSSSDDARLLLVTPTVYAVVDAARAAGPVSYTHLTLPTNREV